MRKIGICECSRSREKAWAGVRRLVAGGDRPFKAVLDRARIPATVRLTRGRDIEAACGQLAAAAASGAGARRGRRRLDERLG